MNITPTFLDQPIYPNKFPLATDQVFVEGESIQTIFLRYCAELATCNDEEILKQYAIYHINAPIFNNDLTDQLRAKDLKNMSLEVILYECLEHGLDPF